jgi:hypothetical protein
MFRTIACRLAIKRTTGIVGLDANPAAREELITVYNETMTAIKVRATRRTAPPPRSRSFAC